MKRRFRILYIISAIIAIGIIITSTLFAWYVGLFTGSASGYIASSNSAYFAGGDGTQNDPYLISNARHLYNLAWLQDIGKFDDADTNTDGKQPFYFELANDIDMSTLVKSGQSTATAIPPVGIDEHPFISIFNGNGYVIENLKVDTSFSSASSIKPDDSVLTSATANTIDNTTNYNINTTYVGFFGLTAKNSLTTTDTKDIQNFILDSTTISSTVVSKMGIVAGYLDTSCENIGVHNSTLKPAFTISETGAEFSKYTLVGDYNSSTTGGASWNTGIGDGGFGKSTSFKNIYDNLQAITPTTNGISTFEDGWAIPFKPEDSQVLPTRTQTTKNYPGQYWGEDTLNVAYSQPATTKNMGYYTGVKIGFSSSTSRPKVIKETRDVPTTFYVPDGAPTGWNSGSSVALPYNGLNAPSQDIIDYLSATYPDGSKNMDYSFEIANNDTVYSATNTFTEALAIVNGTIGTQFANKDIIVPHGTIWVTPIEDGDFKFIVSCSSNGGKSSSAALLVYEITRKEKGNYSTFYTGSSGVHLIRAMEGSINSGLFYYVEIPVEAGKEYVIMTRSNSTLAPRFYYMDIGAEGGSSSSYGSTISGVDFVYRTDNGYSIINDSNLSKVIFKLSTGTAYSSTNSVIIFNRVNESSGPVVYYYIVPNNSISVTITGTGKKNNSNSDPRD